MGKNGRELKGTDTCLAAHRITFSNANLEVLRSESRSVPKEEENLSISFTDATGIPEGCILSVRAGTKGRQTPLSFNEPVKLPTTKAASSLLKVDVFSEYGKARLTMRHGKYDYVAQVQSPEGLPVGTLEFDARDTTERDKGFKPSAAPSVTSSSSSKRAQATVVASSYLDQHGLIQYLQGLLQSVLREKPADPYQFMIEQLQAVQITSGKAETNVSQADTSTPPPAPVKAAAPEPAASPQ